MIKLKWKTPYKYLIRQKVIAGAESHYNAALTEISKLGGYTDRLTSKAYTKGFYDMDHLMTVYNNAGKGATGIFKAATAGQLDNVRHTGKEILETPGRMKQSIADYKEYRAALSEARAAQAAGKSVPAKTQAIIDKYLNNNRGLDIFRVSNVNPTNNIAKGGVFTDGLSHSYKLTHTRAVVGDLVGNVALGTTAYIGMNAAKDFIGDVGQAVLTSVGVDQKFARAAFVNENRKYGDDPVKTDPPTVPPTEAPTVPPTIAPINPTDPPTVPPTIAPIYPTDPPTAPPTPAPVYPASPEYVPIPETGIDKEKSHNAYIIPASIGVTAGIATVIAKKVIDNKDSEDEEDEEQ